MGFFNLEDGSFYDPDGYLFNKEGYDEFGGHYDSDNNYIPGEGNMHLFEEDVSSESDSLDQEIQKDDLVKQLDDEEYYDQEEDDQIPGQNQDKNQEKLFEQFKQEEGFLDDLDSARYHHNEGQQQYTYKKKEKGGQLNPNAQPFNPNN